MRGKNEFECVKPEAKRARIVFLELVSRLS